MTDFDPSEFHRTSDMALVTFLRMSGHDVQDIHWQGGTCYWIFRITEGLLSLIEEFTGEEASVHPKMFNKEFARTKSEFHQNARIRNAQ